jgi:hypothetical protein
LASVIVALAGAGLVRAEKYPLAEAPPAGKYFHVRIDMTLAGEIRVARGGKKVPFKQTATARHDFLERVLEAGKDSLVRKSAQFFQTARATLTVAGSRSQRTLRPGRQLLVAQRYRDEGLTYCPAGTLTRAELELTEHFDTLVLPGLLPGKAVKVGATWKLANPVVAALCNFEGLTSQGLVAKLERVKKQVAVISVKGKAQGIDTGALVKLTVRATGRFDLKRRRLTALEWTQQEERDQGPVSPASTAKITTTLTRSEIKPAKELSDIALVSVPDGFKPPAPLTGLYYRDPDGRYDLVHGREWHAVARTDAHLVMRLMDRGDFVAQVTVAPWTHAQKGKHLSGEEFQQAMAESPGWEQDQVVQTGVVSEDGGLWVYRVSALGELDGVKVMQNFYLVANRDGEQVVLTFTMTPAQAQKIGTRDLALVGSLDFPKVKKGNKR